MKGGPSQGKKGRSKVHRKCRRCGRVALHITKHECAACGHGKSAKLRDYNYQSKKPNRQRKHSK